MAVVLCGLFVALTLPLAAEIEPVKVATNVPAPAAQPGATGDLMTAAVDQDDYRTYLDSRLQMKKAQLDLYQAQLEQAQAQRLFDQTTMLCEAGVASGKSVNDAKKSLDNSAVQVKKMEIALDQARGAALNEVLGIDPEDEA